MSTTAMTTDAVPLPQDSFCAWIHNGQPCNAFPWSATTDARASDRDGYWASKGYTAEPLYTADQMHSHAAAVSDARVAALSQRIAELEAGWMPIESAPKESETLLDGPTILLGYAPDEDYPEGYVAQGRWHQGDDDGPDNMGHDAGFMDDRFEFFHCARSFGNPKYQSKGLQPTHWRPLPPAPDASSIQAGKEG